MSTKRSIFILTFISACFLMTTGLLAEGESPAVPLNANPKLKVAVYQGDKATLKGSSPITLLMLSSGGTLQDGGSLEQTIRIRDGVPNPVFQAGKDIFDIDGFRVMTRRDDEISVNDKKYRGNLSFFRGPGKQMVVVNEIELESYLRGVLPKEMFTTWPAEALKAQAVASRTYALYKALGKEGSVYALRDDIYSQVYGGKVGENPSTDDAVDYTKGQILTYRGKVYPAFFHSTCGGQTSRPKDVWGANMKAGGKSVACSYCLVSPHYAWQSDFTADELETSLKKAGIKVGRIRFIQLKAYDSSNRPREVVIQHSEGKTTIAGNAFRLAVGSTKLKSLKNLQFVMEGDRFRFLGNGYGHGAGLCQWGAYQMAKEGASYRDILKYYYPKARIKDLS